MHAMKYNFKSIRFKIITIILSFCAVIATAVEILSYMITRQHLTESQQQSAYINLQLIGGEINSDLSSALGFSNWLLLDSDVEAYLTRISGFGPDDIVERRRFTMDIWKHLNDEYALSAAHDMITRFIASTPDGSDFIHVASVPGSTTMAIPAGIMNMDCYDELVSSYGYTFTGLYTSPIAPSYSVPVIPVIRPVKSSRSPVTIGFIYVEISSDIITKHLDNIDLPKDSELYITFGDHITYRYEDGGFTEASLPHGLTTYRLPDKNISLSLLPSASELRARSKDQIIILIIILLFILLAGAVTYAILQHMISVPVDALISKLSKVGNGNFTRDEKIEWENELGEIGKGINDLSDNVSALIKNKVEDERTRQALEYRILQSQVNPHFMYNTLNTIKWMATIQGADGIADMSTALSRLLKNVSKGTDNLIPLKDEIALLDDYYTIMKYRYGGTIELAYEIEDEALLKCMVNRFSLQPIVENAIFHGIEPKGSAGRIVIHIYSEEDETSGADNLIIDVTDNGVGMDEETIERIMKGDESSSNDFFKDVGVANVASRIAFTFGNDYGLKAFSKPGSYTTIRFVLPKTSDEEPDRTDRSGIAGNGDKCGQYE